MSAIHFISGLGVPSGGESARPQTAQNLVQIRGAVPAGAQVQGGGTSKLQ